MKHKKYKDTSVKSTSRRGSSVLLITIADTTWRMFLPTIGFTIAGVALDNALPTKPWMTVIGVVVGAVVALGLVVKQLNAVRSDNE